MKPGDTINNPDNVLVRYEPDSCRIVDVHPMPFRSSLLRHYAQFDCGPDLGVRAVIVTKYDPGSMQDTYELAYWAKGAGNFRFEAYDQKTDRLLFAKRFNDFGGPDVQPTTGCWQRAHLDLKPEGDEMNAPSVTVDRYGPVIGPTGTWSVEFHDRNNEGVSGKVEIVNGSVHVTLTNPEGSDRSGNKRPVEVRGV
jgi:hypothetical protein